MLSENKGFTFIELIIAMAIVGVMSLIAINTLPKTREKGMDTNIMSDLNQYQNLLEQYANSHEGRYPTGGNNLGVALLCNKLGANACAIPNASNYNYRVSGATYYIYTRLNQEDEDGNINYYVVCSSGVRGETVNEPTGTACPL